MTAVKRASRHNSRLIAPRLHNVIELADRAARAPEQMQRRFNAFVRISFVVGKINRCGGTVVLADGVNRFRITVAAQIFLENIFFKASEISSFFAFKLTVCLMSVCFAS